MMRWGLWEAQRPRGWGCPCEWDWCPYEDSSAELCSPFCKVNTEQEGAPVNQEEDPHQNDGNLILDLKAFRIVMSKFLVIYKLPSLWYFLVTAQMN